MSDRNTKITRASRLRWVPISSIRTRPETQRELNPAHVDRLALDFDPEQLGFPVVNEIDGVFYVIDGQHRIEMLRTVGWGDQQIQCEVYVGLTEDQEAEEFLRRNNTLQIRAFDKFTIGVQAGREVECEIDRVVRAQGLAVSTQGVPGAIKAVAALRKVYSRTDSATLGRTLRIIRDAYGDPGLVGPVIEGVGLLCQRYNGELDDKVAVDRLSKAHGGVNGLLNRCEVLRKQLGQPKAHCVAAAAVEVINRGRGGKKLGDWWKS